MAGMVSLYVPKMFLGILLYIAQALLLTQAGYSLGRKGYVRMKRIVIPAAFGLWALGVVWALTASRLGEIGRTWSAQDWLYVYAAARLTAQMWINAKGSSFIAAHSSLEKLLLPARMLGNSGVSLMWIVFGVFLGSASGLWMNAVQKEIKVHQSELNHSI